MGPLISPAAKQRVESLIQSAADEVSLPSLAVHRHATSSRSSWAIVDLSLSCTRFSLACDLLGHSFDMVCDGGQRFRTQHA